MLTQVVRLSVPSLIRILWVDDEPDRIRPLVRHLRDDGCHVDVAANGSAALDRLRVAEYDLILLDYKLKDETGFDVLAQLRQVASCPPVVLLSGFATLELAVDAVRRGAVEVRAKPILGPELLEVVRQWRRRALVTPDGIIAPPWTTSVVARLDAFRAALESDRTDLWPSSRQVLRDVGRELAAPDVSIPETIAGAAAFKCLARAPCLDGDRLIEAQGLVVGGVFDRRRLEPDVIRIEARFEGCGSEAGKLRLRNIAQELGLNSAISRQVRVQTKLKPTTWRLGARLRCGVRELACGSGSIKAAGLTAGWTCPEDFSRDVRRAIGMTPEQFRALLN
jgi:DNA-binding response OmpR family regulator